MKRTLQYTMLALVIVGALGWIGMIRGGLDEILLMKLTMTLSIILGVLLVIYFVIYEDKKIIDKF